MKKNITLYAFLIVALFSVLFFGSKTFVKLSQFFYFTRSVNVTEAKIYTKKFKNIRYVVEADCLYVLNGVEYEKKLITSKDSFKNVWQAQDLVEKQQKQNLKLWIHKNKPERVLFERTLPKKEFLSLLLVSVIFLYFYLLGRYIFKIS